VTGSGGVPADPAAAKAVSQVNLEPFKVYARADHAAAGTSLRNFDSGTIRLRGIPPNATVVQAYLYWSYISSTSPCPKTAAIDFDGRTIYSSNFCTGGDPCWGGAALCAYYADVTGLMPGTSSAALANKVINGDYLISRAPTSLDRTGQDPWAPATANFPKVEGATLFVVYRTTTTTGTVYLHHSCDLFTGTLDASLTLVPAAPSTISFIKFSRWGDDGQVGAGTDASPGTSDEQTWFGGPGTCPAGLTQIAGNGSADNQNSDWNGNDGEPLNQLWDTHTSTNLAGLLGSGAGNYCVRYVAFLDCVNAIGYALTVNP